MLTANTTSDRFQRGEHRPFSEVSVAQWVTEFNTSYGNRMFTTLFTAAHLLTYPEQDKCSAHPSLIIFLNSIILFTPRSPTDLFPSKFRPKCCMHFSSLLCVHYVQPISSSQKKNGDTLYYNICFQCSNLTNSKFNQQYVMTVTNSFYSAILEYPANIY
jgi:hypothetical protein